MIKSLVFHIGDPKTGSSSIQSAMQNRACTCDSVTIAPQKELNASALANSLNPNRGSKRHDEEFRKKAQWAAETDADLGIISAEFFSAVRPEALLSALQAFLPRYTESTRIIAYVRPHASQIISSYAQRVKTGIYTGNFREVMEQPTGRQKFPYYPRFDHWQKVFGDRFTLRPFIRDELQGQDVIRDFFHEALLGAEFSLAPVENTNESLFLEEIAGMRVVQSVLTKRNVPKFLKQSIGGAMVRVLALILGRSGNKLQLDQANADRLVAYFMEDARQLDAQFFEGAPMERAMTEAANKAMPVAQSVQARVYFSQDSIDQLSGLAGDLAQLANDKPVAWRRSYQLRIGQIHDSDIEPLNAAQQKNAAAIWGILEQIAQILATGRVGQGSDT